MSAGSTHRSIDLIEGTGAALVGGGVITMALFPLALPMIALLAVAALPLLLLAIAGALLAALVAAPALLLRALWRTSLPFLGRMLHDRSAASRHDRSAPRPREGLANG
jgi:hypothetical protein